MIRAAVFDIDETLYDGQNKRFIPSAIEALKKLQAKGVRVVLATGRPPLTAVVILREGVIPDAIVCANGHLVIDGEGKIVKEYTFDTELVSEVYDYCKGHDIGLLWKYPDKVYEYIHKPVFENFYHKTKSSRSMIVKGVTDIHKTRCPDGGNLGCGDEALAAFNAHFRGRCVGVRIDGESSDLMLSSVNKMLTTAEVLAEWGIRDSECIAFGDNQNDREMLVYAGIGVCMGNGCKELKAFADYVTDDLRNDGIAKALAHFEIL